MSRSDRKQALSGENEDELYCKLPKIVQSKLDVRKSCHLSIRETSLPIPPLENAMEDELKHVVLGLIPKTETNVQGILKSKLDGKVLLLDSTGTLHRKKTTDSPMSTGPSRKKKGKQGFFHISPEAQKYEAFLPMHELWKQYMEQVLQYSSPHTTTNRSLTKFPRANISTMQQVLVKADLHGCYISVVKSKRPSLLGQAGIVIQETENTFRVIAPNDCIKVFPKVDSIFAFELGDFTFTIFGNHFRVRPVERAARKFKMKRTIEL
eukprot:gene7960-707_t